MPDGYSRSMASSGPLMAVEDYLKYSSKPNCEYIDGVLRPNPCQYDAQCKSVRVDVAGTFRAGNLAVCLTDLFSSQA